MLSKFKIDPKVSNAINDGKAVVALGEHSNKSWSSLPENIKVANDSIKAVEESGSVAATIGIIKGEIKIGLNDEDLEILATSKNVEKVSLHNIALSIYEKECSNNSCYIYKYSFQNRINFFATGGIGGFI